MEEIKLTEEQEEEFSNGRGDEEDIWVIQI
jgi:hypothetical protein